MSERPEDPTPIDMPQAGPPRPSGDDRRYQGGRNDECETAHPGRRPSPHPVSAPPAERRGYPEVGTIRSGDVVRQDMMTPRPLTGADLGMRGPQDSQRPATLADVQVRGVDDTMPDEVTDSGVHALPSVRLSRETCPTCEGTGYMPSQNDLLRESLGLLGDGGDMVVREFYTRLLAAAPNLAPLFPADLLTIDASRKQRDKLLGALLALSQSYDRTDPEGMNRLDTALASFGRHHAAFARPDGTVSGATLEEYAAVKAVLFGTLVDAAGPAWKAEYTAAWSDAYDYAAGVMMAEQRRTEMTVPRQPRA